MSDLSNQSFTRIQVLPPTCSKFINYKKYALCFQELSYEKIVLFKIEKYDVEIRMIIKFA